VLLVLPRQISAPLCLQLWGIPAFWPSANGAWAASLLKSCASSLEIDLASAAPDECIWFAVVDAEEDEDEAEDDEEALEAEEREAEDEIAGGGDDNAFGRLSKV